MSHKLETKSVIEKQSQTQINADEALARRLTAQEGPDFFSWGLQSLSQPFCFFENSPSTAVNERSIPQPPTLTRQSSSNS